jgi:hypothetical protein
MRKKHILVTQRGSRGSAWLRLHNGDRRENHLKSLALGVEDLAGLGDGASTGGVHTHAIHLLQRRAAFTQHQREEAAHAKQADEVERHRADPSPLSERERVERQTKRISETKTGSEQTGT